MNDLQSICLSSIGEDWRSLKDIVWEINGPRERTIQQANIRTALKGLVRQKLIERKSGPQRAGQKSDNQQAAFVAQEFYRRRAS